MEAVRSFPRAFPYPPVGRPPLGRSPKAPSFSLHRSSIVVGSVGLTLRRRGLMGLRNSKDAQHSEPSKVVEGETLVQLGQQTLEAIHRFTKSIPEKGVSWLDVGSYKGCFLKCFERLCFLVGCQYAGRKKHEETTCRVITIQRDRHSEYWQVVQICWGHHSSLRMQNYTWKIKTASRGIHVILKGVQCTVSMNLHVRCAPSLAR